MNNFKSKKNALKFFKQTPIDDWSFLGYVSYLKANKDRVARKTTIQSRYRACLNDLFLLKDMKEEGKQKVSELMSTRGKRNRRKQLTSKANYLQQLWYSRSPRSHLRWYIQRTK
ncbi:unnamed protein product [Rhizopus stolonifer]